MSSPKGRASSPAAEPTLRGQDNEKTSRPRLAARTFAASRGLLVVEMTALRRVISASAVVACVALLAGCALSDSTGRESVFEQLHSPSTFFVDPVLEDGERSKAQLVLDEDGSATARDYPSGAVRTEPSGRVCLEPNGELVSAQGTWRADDKGHIFISFEGSESLLGAGTKNMGELDWARPGLAFCGRQDVLLFVTRDARE